MVPKQDINISKSVRKLVLLFVLCSSIFALIYMKCIKGAIETFNFIRLTFLTINMRQIFQSVTIKSK